MASNDREMMNTALKKVAIPFLREQATYSYDPNGLRKTKTVGTETLHYYYDGTDLIRVTDLNNQTLWRITWANGQPVSLTNKDGKTFYYITNYRGDILQILDQNGVEVASYDYNPWRDVLRINEDLDVEAQPLGYASYIYDRETKIYYLKARYLDSATARFISHDEYPGDVNTPFTQNGYIYANDNPVMLVDPEGYSAREPNTRLLALVGVATLQLIKNFNNEKAAFNYLQKQIGKIFKGLKNKYTIKFNPKVGPKYGKKGKGNLVLVLKKGVSGGKGGRVFAVEYGIATYLNNKNPNKKKKEIRWHFHIGNDHYSIPYFLPKGYHIQK